MTPDDGDSAIDFVLGDSTGTERSLGSLVANGPCVLVFARFARSPFEVLAFPSLLRYHFSKRVCGSG